MKIVTLRGGKEALVDDEDYERVVAACSWQPHNKGYAQGKLKTGKRGGKHVLMHRFIVGAPRELQVDHRDGNRLNNQKSNLRLCTNTQNSRSRVGVRGSTSRFKGVFFCKQTSRWRASIKVNDKNIHLGRFDTQREAAEAYNRKAAEVFGEFAKLNDTSNRREN